MTPQDRIYARRFLLLADKLDHTLPERFYFGHWWSGSDPLCHTTACALGTCASMPEFQALGLCLFATKEGFHFVGLIDEIERHEYDDIDTSLTQAPLRAAFRAFGVDEIEFEFLFIPRDDYEDTAMGHTLTDIYGRLGPERDASAQEVAAHIRWFVECKYGQEALNLQEV
jgi:hypothetical protein